MADDQEEPDYLKILKNNTQDYSEEWFSKRDTKKNCFFRADGREYCYTENVVTIDSNAPKKIPSKPVDYMPILFLGSVLLVIGVLAVLIKRMSKNFPGQKSGSKKDVDSNEPTHGPEFIYSPPVSGLLISIVCTFIFVGVRLALKSAGLSPSEAIVLAIILWIIIVGAIYMIQYLFSEFQLHLIIKKFFKSMLGKVWVASTISWLLCIVCYIYLFEPFGYRISQSEWLLIYKLVVLPPVLVISIIIIFRVIVR